MFEATTRPAYLPTWVSGQMPVTSPIAQTLLAGRHALVDLDVAALARLDADRLEAEAVGARPRARWRPAACRRAARAARGTRGRTRRRRAARREACWPKQELDAVGLEHSAERLAERRAARGAARAPCPRRAPPRRPCARAPAPSRRRPGRRRGSGAGAGTSLSPVASRFVQTPSSSRRPVDRRDHGIGAGRDHDVRRSSRPSPSTSTAPGPAMPAVAAEQLDALLLEPLGLRRVVVVRDHEVAPLERRRRRRALR